ncbi:MAG: DUF190 domain-containing protein [Deltaproteobacteria bacterium]|nr:DUF190 domain-containing protein [Deltaproteobacteria bacterium]
MNTTQGLRLRIYLGEADHLEGAPLHQALVTAARQAGLAGCTVWRGVESFGASRALHTAKVLRLSEDLPLVVECVDTPENIHAFADQAARLLRAAACGGLATLEPVSMAVFPPAS